MTDVLIDDTLEDRGSGLLLREFAADISSGEGRTVDVRIVPYGEQIQHNDGLGGQPKGVVYREGCSAGAFDHQLKAAHRVLANVEHQEGIGGVVGHGLALMERQDGLYGSFKIHDTPDGDKALILIREGVFDKVSLEAIPRRAVRTAEGVIRRVKVDLLGLAFSRFGAYKGAKVLAVREEAIFDEELLVADLDPEVVERCRRVGIRLPQRYDTAHPDDTDTPAVDAGTSEDGTRQTEPITTESEE